MKHQTADALPRLQTTGEDNTPFEDDPTLLAIYSKGDSNSVLLTNANSDEIIALDAQGEISVDTPPAVEEPTVK